MVHNLISAPSPAFCTNKPEQACFKLGIDVGTSGIRAVIVNAQDEMVFQHACPMPSPIKRQDKSEQDPQIWLNTLRELLHAIKQSGFSQHIRQAVLDATSSTVLLCNSQGQALTPALMYDDKRAQVEAQQIKTHASAHSGAHGASSTLAKVMWLEKNTPTETLHHNCDNHSSKNQPIICHQIDFLNHYLCGVINLTDENNALKLGYDSQQQAWPKWIQSLTQLPLPKVTRPGRFMGKIRPEIAQAFNLSPQLQIYAGTTDSIAAFLAAGANQVGEAVSSLGSTLAIKLLSPHPIFAPEFGVYSHFVQGKWLVGGASNAGGAVLLKYFDLNTLQALLAQIHIHPPTGLHYYPLCETGERFPIANAQLAPALSPRPKDDATFLQAILEGLTQIEVQSYDLLQQLGAPKARRIYTCGGGTKNAIWMAMRKHAIDADILTSANIDAAFGVTKLITSAEKVTSE